MPLPHAIRAVTLVAIALAAWAAEPIRVCATVPDLGDIARRVGGDAVEVAVFVRGTEDPHEIEPRPSFAKSLARADLLVSVGLDLEIEWLPTVITQSRNERLVKGQPAWFEASTAIQALGVQAPPAEGAPAPHAHTHAAGNPHFLSDPVCGVQVAGALAKRLAQLDAARADAYAGRYRAFAVEVAKRLLGDAVVARVGEAAAIAALESGDTVKVVGDGADLGGWLAAVRPFAGAKVVADHDLWTYAARRFGFAVVAFMEPEPGEPPTTRHLADVVTVAKGSGARLIISNPAFDQRHTRFVAEHTGLPIAILAHQTGALPEAGDLIATVDGNVRILTAALGKPK